MISNSWIAFLVFFPFLGALISYLIGLYSKKARNIAANVITISEFAVTIYLVLNQISGTLSGTLTIPGICGLGLHFTLDGFRDIYSVVVAFMWMMVTLLSPEYFRKYRNRNRFYAFLLITLGATMGVFLSTDFYTTFIFFEIMSLTSYVWVAHEENKEAMRAAETYLGISVLGGMVMLMGIFMLWNSLHTVTFDELLPEVSKMVETNGALSSQMIAAGICIFFGFAVKAGAFPVHIWLPKAHPVAPAPASALLSGVLTKTGIFGIIVVTLQIFAKTEWFGFMLMGIAVVTMLLGAILAIFSVNLKRVLACSSLSQIGFILNGLAALAISGGENALAARGTMIYMVNHSILKLVLFMSAGVIYMNIHKLDLNSIRGFGRKKILLHIAFLLGVLGISGIPFLNGYVGKTLIHEGIVEVSAIPSFVEILFLIAGGCTLAYMLKLYVCIFIEKNSDAALQEKNDANKKYMNPASAIALMGSAVIIPIIGLVPNVTADALMNLSQGFFGIEAFHHEVKYFAFANMKGSLVSIGIGIVLYLAVVRICLMSKNADGKREYKDYWPKWADLENVVYRPIFICLIPFVFAVLCRILDSLVDGFVVLLRKTIYRDSPLPHELPEGNVITHSVAALINGVIWVLNHTFCKKKPIQKSMEHILAVRWEEEAENNQIIVRSLSYGLIIFCIGLVLTIAYLMWVLLRTF